MNHSAEEVASAGRDVSRVCGWLVSPSPEILDRSRDLLETAVCRLTALRGQLRPDHPKALELLAMARALRRTTERTGRLLHNAWAYYDRWGQLLRASTQGYTRGGEPAPFSAPARFSVRG